MKVVALVSGGIDSAVMCRILSEDGFTVFPVFVDYGQHAAEHEWKSCENLVEKEIIPKVTKIDLSNYGRVIQSGLTSKEKDVFHDAFLPGRNLLLLTIAGAYALQNECEGIAIGLLNNDTPTFPDQSNDFLVNANIAINNALGRSITIITPLIQFNKSQSIKLAEKKGINLGETWSCHQSNQKYCGRCVSCIEIINSGEMGRIKKF